MKLHLGCGKNIKEGYINIDKYVNDLQVQQTDILNMPFADNTADEILSEHLVEHIGFDDEEQFWRESFRVLKPNGIMITESPDFEWVCDRFLKADDAFNAFYVKGSADHYFGNGLKPGQRWGVLTTLIFGNQNGEGQFHRNAYTEKKFMCIAQLVGFSECTVNRIFNKHSMSLVATMIK